MQYAPVAQGIERLRPKEGVAGSNPARSTIYRGDAPLFLFG